MCGFSLHFKCDFNSITSFFIILPVTASASPQETAMKLIPKANSHRFFDFMCDIWARTTTDLERPYRCIRIKNGMKDVVKDS